MRKLMAILAIVGMTASSQAATGWFDDFILASVDGGADNSYFLEGSGTAFNGYNFGNVVTLEFGADMKYWADNGDNREGGAFYYQIDAVGQTEVIWSHASIGGNDYQGTQASTINVAQGLSLGAHTVTVWAKSWGSVGGDSWLSNGGANYSATFTVVPEPATMALFGLGVLGMIAYRARKS